MKKLDKLMIYYVVASLHLYRDNIVVVPEEQTPAEFTKRNAELIRHIHDDALRVFHYHLSSEQMSLAITAYLAPGVRFVQAAPATKP